MRGDALSRQFAAALHRDAAPAGRLASGGLVGIEHEYHVLREGVRTDFATLIDGLDLGRRFLDPGDANARRLASGAAVTCDGTEAEIALPPISVRPGFSVGIRRRAATERRLLGERLGAPFALDGSSTHISVSVPAPVEMIDRVARVYARTFAPALMLLLDRRDSYGIYLRPRPGRLEVCAEYASGERLQAAVVFAAGSVRASRAAATQSHRLPPRAADGQVYAMLPPRLRLLVQPCDDRYGHLVHRHCAGGDLYADGRSALLSLESGSATTAQRQLESAWSVARHAIAPFAASEELAVVDRVVGGDEPLPVAGPEGEERAVVPGLDRPDVHGRLTRPIRRPGFHMAAVMLTWDAAVLLAEPRGGHRRAFVCVPRPALRRFVDAVDSGTLDAVIDAYLRSRPWGRRLHQRNQMAMPGLYDAIGPRRALLSAEPEASWFSSEVAA